MVVKCVAPLNNLVVYIRSRVPQPVELCGCNTTLLFHLQFCVFALPQCMVGKCATLVDNLVEFGPLPFQLHLQICVYQRWYCLVSHGQLGNPCTSVVLVGRCTYYLDILDNLLLGRGSRAIHLDRQDINLVHIYDSWLDLLHSDTAHIYRSCMLLL